MRWFYVIVASLWLMSFALIFYFLSDVISISLPEIKIKNAPACVNNLDSKVTKDVILLDKNGSTPEIKIQSNTELPTSEDDIQKTIEQRMQTEFENRLVAILVRINSAACDGCTQDDKKIILQLQMMKALLDGNPTGAFRYSKELNAYLKTK